MTVASITEASPSGGPREWGHAQWSRPLREVSVTLCLATPPLPFSVRSPGCCRRALGPRGTLADDYASEAPIDRLVLWNIDLTLVDVGRVTRGAYAEAFRRVTGRPLVQLPRMAGRIESEIFFDA